MDVCESNCVPIVFHLFICRDAEGENSAATSFHRLFVYDEPLRLYIKNNLKKTDRVLVNGRIGHMTYTSADGKKMYSGFIVADEIHKVARRTTSEVELNEGSKLEAENKVAVNND